MAPKKTPQTDDDALAMPAGEADLDQAIDDLRGVLKTDSDGGLGDFGDFGGTSTGGLSDFESDFGGGEPASDFGGSDFGGSDFGGSDLGGSDFGGADLGGSDFGSSSSSFGGGESHQAPGSALDANMDLIMDIPIDVQIVLGSSRMPVSALMSLEEGATIALDKKIGEPVEIMVNGRRIARGEITVLENDDTRFGVKLIEVLGSKAS